MPLSIDRSFLFSSQVRFRIKNVHLDLNGIEESKERTTELFLVADHTALEKPGAAVTVRRKKFPDRIFGPNKNRINSLVDLEGKGNFRQVRRQ